MASPLSPVTYASTNYGSDVDIDAIAALSDYGSDFDAADIDEDTLLGTTLESITTTIPKEERESVLSSVDSEESDAGDNGCSASRPWLLRAARGNSVGDAEIAAQSQPDPRRSPVRAQSAAFLEVEYDEPSRRAWSVPTRLDSSVNGTELLAHPYLSAPEAAKADIRSPLERFRTKPKHPLCVTDLVSPGWCELQFFYSLSKFGKTTKTKAMQKGSKIHKKLEKQVHRIKTVRVQSNEDRFGLKLWNAIVGLRCLRQTGCTRELQVWGVIGGEVVSGIIDEVSYECPDAEFEQQVELQRAQTVGDTIPLPPTQPGIAESFARATGEKSYDDVSDRVAQPDRHVYIMDVKTRATATIPTGPTLRQAQIQLMIYRKLLQSLSMNTVDAEIIFQRYGLRSLESFTPFFVEAVGAEEATGFSNLLALWSLLITELSMTFSSHNISPILRVEYRYAKTGDVLSSELSVYEEDVIGDYLNEKMAWWKGKREARGVEIEEAFKCRSCEFADECTWRKAKVEESIMKSRMRKRAAKKSAV